MREPERLRRAGIFNNHELIRRFGELGKDVWCQFQPGGRGAAAGTAVHSPSHPTDAEAHWIRHGRKFFPGKAKASMAEAEAWASERYGVASWRTSPFGGRVPAAALAFARAALAAGRPDG